MAPIFNEAQLQLVERMKATLEAFGFGVFSPYHASREIWAGRKPSDCSPEERHEVLLGNVVNLDDAQLCIAVLGMTDLDVPKDQVDPKVHGKTDTGVAWEMGYATSRNGATTVRGVKSLDQINEFMIPEPCVLGYVDPADVRQGKDVNLMLAGTLDAAVRGMAQFKRAVELYANHDPRAMFEYADPAHTIGHEE